MTDWPVFTDCEKALSESRLFHESGKETKRRERVKKAFLKVYLPSRNFHFDDLSYFNSIPLF